MSNPSDTLSVADRFKQLNVKQVAEYVGVTTTRQVWYYVREGIVPPPRYLKPHAARWQLGELIDHIEAQMKAPEEVTRGFKGNPQTPTKVDKSILERMRERLNL